MRSVGACGPARLQDHDRLASPGGCRVKSEPPASATCTATVEVASCLNLQQGCYVDLYTFTCCSSARWKPRDARSAPEQRARGWPPKCYSFLACWDALFELWKSAVTARLREKEEPELADYFEASVATTAFRSSVSLLDQVPALASEQARRT